MEILPSASWTWVEAFWGLSRVVQRAEVSSACAEVAGHWTAWDEGQSQVPFTEQEGGMWLEVMVCELGGSQVNWDS